MYKKLIGLTLPILALAVAVHAPAASASPVLTNEGKAVSVGTEITGTNIGTFRFTTPFGTECTAVGFNFLVTENSGAKLKLEAPFGKAFFSGTGAGVDCTSSTGASNIAWITKVCLEATSGDKVIATGCGAKAAFTTTITTGGFELPCRYAANSFTGTFVTNADAAFTFVEQEFAKETGFCTGTRTLLDLAFELTTIAGETLVIS